MKNKKRNYIILLLFTVLVLFFTLKDDFGIIYKNIISLNPWWFIYSLFLIFGYWFFKTLILKLYINYYKPQYRFKKAFKLEMETLFFNGITPFSSGGQPFQVIAMKKENIRISDGANIIFIISFIHQFALFLISLFAIILNSFLDLFKINSTIKYLSILGFIINVLFMIFLLILMFNKKFKKNIVKIVIKILDKINIVKDRDKVIKKWEEKLEILDNGSKVILKNKKGFIISVLYNVMALLCYFVVPVSLAYGMGLANSFSGIEAIITSSYVVLVGMFIPIPGGTGGLEYAFIALFSNFISTSNAKSMMLVWRFITYYVGMIIGGIILNISNKKDSEG